MEPVPFYVLTLPGPATDTVIRMGEANQICYLPPGTRVFVCSTLLKDYRSGYGAKIPELYSEVRVPIDQTKMPKEIVARYDYPITAGEQILSPVFKGVIRPAPWEPVDTPPERRINWSKSK